MQKGQNDLSKNDNGNDEKASLLNYLGEHIECVCLYGKVAGRSEECKKRKNFGELWRTLKKINKLKDYDYKRRFEQYFLEFDKFSVVKGILWLLLALCAVLRFDGETFTFQCIFLFSIFSMKAQRT